MPQNPLRPTLRLAAVIALATASAAPPARADDPPVDPDHAAKMQKGLALFKEKVRPLLVKHCLGVRRVSMPIDYLDLDFFFELSEG